MQTHDSEFHRTTKPGSLYPFLRTTQAQLRPIHPHKLKSNLTASVLTSKVSIVTKRSDWIPSKWNTTQSTDQSATQPANSSIIIAEAVPGSPEHSQTAHMTSQHSHAAVSSSQSIVISRSKHHSTLLNKSHELSASHHYQQQPRPLLPATVAPVHQQTHTGGDTKAGFLKNPRDRIQLAPYLHRSLDNRPVRNTLQRTAPKKTQVRRMRDTRPAGVVVVVGRRRDAESQPSVERGSAGREKGLAQGSGRGLHRSLLRPKDPQVPTFPTLKYQNTEQEYQAKIQLKDKYRATVVPQTEGLSTCEYPSMTQNEKYDTNNQQQLPILVEQPHPWDSTPPASLMKNRITCRPRHASRSEDPPAKPSSDQTSRSKDNTLTPGQAARPTDPLPANPHGRPATQSASNDFEEDKPQNKDKERGEGVSDGDWSRRSAESTGRNSLPQLGFLLVGCCPN